MKWMIIRHQDESSSDICREIEAYAKHNRGLEFPVTINGISYGNDTIERALMASGQYYTHLFHKNCRSHLIPISDALTEMDEIDETMMHDSALAHNENMKLRKDDGISEASKLNYFINKMKDRAIQIWKRIF